MIRKTCVLFLALVLGAALAGAEGSENFLAELDALTEGDTISYETRTMTCYIGNLDSYVDVTLCFFSGEEQIPFIEAEEMADLYVTLCRAFGEENAGLYVSGEDGIARFTRENGYEMSANYLTGEVSFIDYDAFLQEPGGHALLDTVGETGFDSEGLPALFERVNAQSYDRYGSAVTLNLSGYHIPTVAMDAGWYMPLQTFGDRNRGSGAPRLRSSTTRSCASRSICTTASRRATTSGISTPSSTMWASGSCCWIRIPSSPTVRCTTSSNSIWTICTAPSGASPGPAAQSRTWRTRSSTTDS